jgi:RNA polymerase sigma factor (TIGR02999 family)
MIEMPGGGSERERRDITEILLRLKGGDASAETELIPVIYPELRRLAGRHLRRERPGHTLQATALVHEVYLRLIGNRDISWANRSHFFAVASRIMRRILVDYARNRKAGKRGGSVQVIELDESVALSEAQSDLVLVIDQCLQKLAEMDLRQAQVVEMRFFGGLTEREIAIVLGVSTRTVKRDWIMARAWLHAELGS